MSRETEGSRAPDEAWLAFCEALKQAGAVLRNEAIADDELSIAEGHRHLLRMIRAGFEVVSEYGDPAHPQIFPMASATVLSEGVTSDARYDQAFVDGMATHIIRGRRGTAPLIEIGIYEGRMGFHESNGLQNCLTEAELEVAKDGSFEVTLGPEPRPGNWIQSNAESHYLFIRQYAHDWSTTERGTFEIEREGASGYRKPLTLDEIRAALERTSAFVQQAPAVWSGISDYWAGYASNQIVTQETAASDTDIVVPSGHRFACGYFRLEPDEAVVIEFDPPAVGSCAYWGIHLDNYWYEPLSWTDGRSQLNDRTVERKLDGSVVIVVSAEEPTGAPNWLDTQAHTQGTMVFRWSRSDAPCPTFHCRVVRTADWSAGGSDQ
jgi:hypothetical protein